MEVEVRLHLFLSSVVEEGDCSTSRSGRLASGENPGKTLNMSLGVPQSRSESFGEVKSLPPTGVRILDRAARSLVAISTTVSRYIAVKRKENWALIYWFK
jgi:hypothetical protein